MEKSIKITLFTLATLVSPLSIAAEIPLDFVKKEIEIAYSQYFKGSPKSGLYALEALSRILELDKYKSIQSEIGPNNLSFTFFRIGLLHETSGDDISANIYFNKALKQYVGKPIKIGELKSYVSELDKRAQLSN
jgi:hypothetical protein